MRIVVVDRATFIEVWAKTFPAKRVTRDIGCSHLYDPAENILVVVDEEIVVSELPEFDGEVNLAKFNYQAVNPEYKVL